MRNPNPNPKQKFSNYDSIPDELQYLRFAEIDEPLLIKFEDETESRSIFYDGDIFEIDTPQQPEFRMSMNSMGWNFLRAKAHRFRTGWQAGYC